MNIVQIMKEDLGIELNNNTAYGFEAIFEEKIKGFENKEFKLRVGENRVKNTIAKFMVFDLNSERFKKIFVDLI